LAALLPLLANGQENRLRNALELLVNAAMLLERQQHLCAEPGTRACVGGANRRQDGCAREKRM
jgi:hypothetical protein